MKTILVLVGLIAVTQARVIVSQNGGSRIINGWNAEAGEIPYQVSLQNSRSNFHFCGGSILNKNFVITAAHCVENQIESRIQVIGATVKLSEPVKKYPVQKIIVHKEYNPDDTYRNDIALVKIKGEFIVTSVLSYVPLPKPQVFIPANTVAVVSGWGRLAEVGSSPDHLQIAELLIADQNYCKKQYEKFDLHVHETQVCAHDPEKEIGSCYGDSGGPLTVNGELIGLVSWANGCANMKYPTVYTRVPEYLDWIEANAI